MSGDTLLRPELTSELERLGGADIVVGIPSFNNARTIAHVVRAISIGLAKYYPDRRCVLVNSDGGSKDGTPGVVLDSDLGELPRLLVEHPSRPIQRLATGYLGVPGKGSAFRTIFRVAERLGARACAVFDSDLRSITPEWVELLLEPVLDHGLDFVAPLYSRHKYDGTITNSIVYPLTRALYGKRVRQPIGGDFGFSGALASHFLAQGAWETDVARYGIDIWMTTRAIADGYAVGQSYLGAKIHDTKDPGADLSAMFTQVVGTVFDLMEGYRGVWAGVLGSAEVPTFGFRYTVGVEPVAVNVERMIGLFRQGAADLASLWCRILDRSVCDELAARAAGAGDFDFPPELWVRCVYGCAASCHRRVMPREHILKAMIPLYLGRTAAFVLQTVSADGEAVEAEIERLCGHYESAKADVLATWDG
jgi:glycosyltransferase involved in cell wall biosynthesis